MENIKMLSYKNNEHFNILLNIQKNSIIKKDQQNTILQLLKQCEQHKTKLFSQKLTLSDFEQMMTMIFEYKQKKDYNYKKNILNLINMLKNGGQLAQFIINNPKFHKQCIFGFLTKNDINQNILTVFGDIFINVARNNPVKVLNIIKDQDVQNILIRNLKKSQVMNVIYTAIFCLNNTQSSQFGNFIDLVLYGILKVPFDDDDGKSFLTNCVCFTQVANEHQHQHQHQHKQPLYNKYIKFCTDRCINKNHCFFEQDNERYFDQVVNSIQNIGDMIHQVQINIDVINIKNAQILINLIIQTNYIKKLFQMLRININIQRKYKTDLITQIFKLLYEIIKLLKIFIDFTKHEFHKYYHCRAKTTIFDKKIYKRSRKYSIQSKLQDKQNSQFKSNIQIKQHKSKSKQNQKFIKYQQNNAIQLIIIASQISQYLLLYSQQLQQLKSNKRSFQQSSGLKIQSIGLQKYWILKIHDELLTIIGTTNHNIHTKYHLKSALPTLLPLIQQCMISNRWNNIIQKLITQIIKHYLKYCYSDFYHQAVNIQKKQSGFLGFLIQHFRNKYHIFLNTMKFAHQGDRNTIFQISQLIALELYSNRDLLWLFNNFGQWKQFFQKDLVQYQKICTNKYYFDQTMIENQHRSTKNTNSQNNQCHLIKYVGLEKLMKMYKSY